MPMIDRPSSRTAPLVVALCATLALTAHAARYYPFLSDDALISLRYAARLLEGKGLTWTEGHRVEGYSNLLWTLLVAFLGFLRVDLILAARLLGLGCMGTVAYAIARYQLERRRGIRAWLPLAVGLGFFVSAGPTAVWAIGGLEQPLYAALIAFSIPLTIRLIESASTKISTLLALSFVLGLLCITRPDGPLFSVTAFLSILIGRKFMTRTTFPFIHSVALAAFPLLFFGSQTVFRLGYYGEWVPNTALIKITPSIHHFANGARYVFHGLTSLLPFSLVAVLFLLVSPFSESKRACGLTLLLLCGLWGAYVIFIGGDVFPAYRHMIPIVVAFSFALVEATESLLGPERGSARRRVGVVAPLALIGFIFFVGLQFTRPEARRAIEERWEWDGQKLGLLLKEAFDQDQPLVAVTAAGCIPYWSELPAVDMLGLNDYYIPRHPPEDFGKGHLGHEFGDPDYVLRREPDIIVFHVGNLLGHFRVSQEIQQRPEFYSRYVPVQVTGIDPDPFTPVVWIRKNSPRIGIRRSPSALRLPGYLLIGKDLGPARLNPEGDLVRPIEAGQSAGIVIDSVPDVDWEIRISGSSVEGLVVQTHRYHHSTVLTVTGAEGNSAEIEEIVLQEKL